MQLSFSNSLSGLYKLLAFVQTVFPCLKEKNFAHIFVVLYRFVSSIAFFKAKGIYYIPMAMRLMMCTSFNDVNVTKNRRLVELAKTILLGSFIYCRILNTDLAITEAAAPKNTKKETKFGLSLFTGR